MSEFIRILYIAFIGFMFFNMLRGKGCCGGGMHNKENDFYGTKEKQYKSDLNDRVLGEGKGNIQSIED